jgi:hypothetical protein
VATVDEVCKQKGIMKGFFQEKKTTFVRDVFDMSRDAVVIIGYEDGGVTLYTTILV